MGMIQEFKKFALRGNMVDMAVGIVVGGAFGTIVKSLVADIIMPPLGLLTGGVDFANLVWQIKDPVTKTVDGVEKTIPAVTINYGTFINNVIAFLIVAWAVFLVVKAMNAAQSRLWKEQEEQPAAPPPAPEDILLLREIRDSLKKP